MSRKHKRGGHGGGHEGPDERWLLTYADMITLLLALFILLFAMSSIDVVKFNAVAESISSTFKGNVITGQPAVIDGAPDPLSPQDLAQHTQQQRLKNEGEASQKKQMKNLESSVNSKIKSSTLKGKAEALTTEKGVVIRLAGDALFQSGSAQMNSSMQPAMKEIAKLVANQKRNISVEGHTDGVPIHTAQFPSNWELSGDRALTIMRYLLDNGVAGNRVHFTGYADKLPIKKPTGPNQSIAKNRRVEIIILSNGTAADASAPTGTKDVSDNGTGSSGPGGGVGRIGPSDDLVGPIINLSGPK